MATITTRPKQWERPADAATSSSVASSSNVASSSAPELLSDDSVATIMAGADLKEIDRLLERVTQNECARLLIESRLSLGEARAKFQTEQRLWKEDCAKLVQLHNVQDVVRLNVGGSIFATQLQTLLKLNDTFFSNMFSGRFELHKNLADDAYFLDRDGSVFGLLVQYLREWPNSTLNPQKLNTSQRVALKADADFYRITPLIELLQKTSDINTVPMVCYLTINDVNSGYTTSVQCSAAALSCTLPTKK
jgi:hypothetical protein